MQSSFTYKTARLAVVAELLGAILFRLFGGNQTVDYLSYFIIGASMIVGLICLINGAVLGARHKAETSKTLIFGAVASTLPLFIIFGFLTILGLTFHGGL